MQQKDVVIRRFRAGDEAAVSEVIRTALDVSNRRDYAPEFIENASGNTRRSRLRRTHGTHICTSPATAKR